MAGFDYLKCENCGKRLLFDPSEKLRASLQEIKETIFCGSCVKKLLAKARKKRIKGA